MPVVSYSVTITQSRRAGGIGALPTVTDAQIATISQQVAQVLSTDVLLGTPDCPVTIYRPNGNLAPTYVESTGVANLALLQTLITNWAQNGTRTGRIVFPAGTLHTAGTLVIRRDFSGVFTGCSSRAIVAADVREMSQGLSEWYMQKVTGATGFRPGAACQTIGPEFHNIFFRSRRRVLAGDAYTDTGLTSIFYQAAQDVVDGAVGDFDGFVSPSGTGTGKLRFTGCGWDNGASTPCLQQGVLETPLGNGADTAMFDWNFFGGSGPSLNVYQTQAIENTFNDCYWQTSGTPNLVNIYRGGGTHFNGGTITEPAVMVKLHANAADSSSSLWTTFHNFKLDNFATPGLLLFDGRDDESCGGHALLITKCHWPVETLASDGYLIRMGPNQSAIIRDCVGVQAPLFTTKEKYLAGTHFGETDYTFRPYVEVVSSMCRVAYGSPATLSSLRSSTGNVGTNYRLTVQGNYNSNMKPFVSETFGA